MAGVLRTKDETTCLFVSNQIAQAKTTNYSQKQNKIGKHCINHIV
jgi:hypothetical protein